MNNPDAITELRAAKKLTLRTSPIIPARFSVAPSRRRWRRRYHPRGRHRTCAAANSACTNARLV